MAKLEQDQSQCKIYKQLRGFDVPAGDPLQAALPEQQTEHDITSCPRQGQQAARRLAGAKPAEEYNSEQLY